MWLKVGVVNKVGVLMTTPTCNAFESKPLKASISAFSENIQLKKAVILPLLCSRVGNSVLYRLFLYRVSLAR